MMIRKALLGGALGFFLLSSSLALAHSAGSSPQNHQQKSKQGSGTKQYAPMKSTQPGTNTQGSGMSGCNIATETGWLGLEVVDLDRSAHPDMDHGVSVKGVIPGGPADKAGIKAGDILVTLDGKFVNSVDQLENSSMGFPIGYNAEVGVKSGDQTKTVTVKVAKRQSSFGMRPMMAGGMSGGGSMPGNLRPGMFMEDMMKRSPLGKMQQGGINPGPTMMFGGGQGSNQRVSGYSGQSQAFSTSTRSPDKRDIKYLYYEKELNLSTDQVNALKKLQRKTDKILIQLDAAIKVAQIDMEELLNESSVDMDKVENKIREIEKYRADRSLKQIRSLTEAKSILTKDQQKKFEELNF